MLTERDRKYLLKLKEKIISRCPKCRGQNISCTCLDTFRLEFRKVKANIPSKYRDASLEQITHPQTANARLKLNAYLLNLEHNHSEGLGLFLFGNTGLAKTFSACAILIEVLKRQMSTYFVTLDHCVSMYAAGWRDAAAKELFEEVIISSDFLALDEVGNEPRTNLHLVKNCLNDILRQRSNQLLPTIITSNLLFDPKNIVDVYGEEVWSILNESTIPVEFRGVDFRQSVIKEANETL